MNIKLRKPSEVELRQFYNTGDECLELLRMNLPYALNSKYCVAAYFNNDIVGIAGIRIQRVVPLPSLFIAVLTKFQNQGIGSELLQNVKDYAIRRYGFLALSTFNNSSYSKAIGLYKSFGFRQIPLPGKM